MRLGETPTRAAVRDLAEHEGLVVADHGNQNFAKKINPYRPIGPAQSASGIGGSRLLDR